jgi:hypothetical protein
VRAQLVCGQITRLAPVENGLGDVRGELRGGLEQELNSLQAQREACEAFINGQWHEGWVCLPACYDVGGFSGATDGICGCRSRSEPLRSTECCCSRWPRHRLASARTEALARLVRPKNRGPDQCAPVIFSAITVSER